MAASKDISTPRPDPVSEPDIDFAGYDPYIVAITASAHPDASSLAGGPAETPESRKVQLMTWLRENGA